MIVLKVIVNWFLILTVPIWGGVLMFGMLAVGAFKGEARGSAVLNGRRWLWE